MQAEVLQAARQRIVDDIARTVTILKGAAGEARKAVAPVEAVSKAAPKKKAPAPRKARAKAKKPASRARAKRVARKTARR
jgi:hypothetical protein